MKCPNCGTCKPSYEFLCFPCWRALTHEARAALLLDDDRAGIRRLELYEQLRASAAPHDITITIGTLT